MLYAAISRWQSLVAASHLHDYASVARDIRITISAVGFRSERRARLSGHRQSTFRGGLCEFVVTVKGYANSARGYINARTYHVRASDYPNRYADHYTDRTGSCPCDASAYAKANETPKTEAV